MEVRIYTVNPLRSWDSGYLVVFPTGPDLSGVDPRTLGETWYLYDLEETLNKVSELIKRERGNDA